jgi:hypothetical protein
VQRLDRERHADAFGIVERGGDAIGSAPTTSTRQGAPIALASSTALRLSSSAARSPAASAAGKNPPRQ